MKKNEKGRVYSNCIYIAEPGGHTPMAGAALKWAGMVNTGSPWDHKPKVKGIIQVCGGTKTDAGKE